MHAIGDLLQLLDVQPDEKMLPTTYGELRPPLGTHRLKVPLPNQWVICRRTNSAHLPFELLLWILFDHVYQQIVEFLAVLLKTNSEGARQELVRLGAIQIILKLFYE